MSHATHPCPPASPAPSLSAAGTPLRVDFDPATGNIVLAPVEAVRIAVALSHLAAVVQWSPGTRASDEVVANEAAWMAETLGDRARAGS